MIPGVLAHMNKLKVDFLTFSVTWYISVFTAALPEDASLAVLDIFFLKGRNNIKVLMHLTFGLLSVLEQDIVKASLEDLYSKVFVNNNPSL